MVFRKRGRHMNFNWKWEHLIINTVKKWKYLKMNTCGSNCRSKQRRIVFKKATVAIQM